MGPSGRITHVIGYIGYIGYIALFGTSICRFCIWVELPVQRRLYPIFVRNVGSPCDALKPGGPLTTRQPAEYKWRSGYPTPL